MFDSFHQQRNWHNEIPIAFVNCTPFTLVAYTVNNGALQAQLDHICPQDNYGVVKNSIQLTDGGYRFYLHQDVFERTVTIEPDIYCPDCGLRGYIHRNQWVPLNE